MTSNLMKFVVGLALKNEFYNQRLNKRLLNIYSSPSLDAIKELHDQLIVSEDHFDREAAFLLELALQQAPVRIDLQDVNVELNQMELLLYDLLWRVEPNSQSDLNDWMNYLANVPQSIRDGFGVDAKILMSLAVQSSRKKSIERIKLNPGLRYKIDVLQRETSRLFELIKRLPVRLVIPEERLRIIVELQDIVIGLLRRNYLDPTSDGLGDLISYPIQRLEASQRYLTLSEMEEDKAKKEIELAYEYLETRVNTLKNRVNLELFEDILDRLRSLVKSFN